MRVRLTAAPDVASVVADAPGRRITGTLIPFDHIGTPSVGPERIMFTRDAALTLADGMILNLEHDATRPIGRAVDTQTTDDGVLATFAIAATAAGSDALLEAAEGLRAGLSIEAVDVDGHWIDAPGGQVFAITAAVIDEAALVRRAAFPAAAVLDVAATGATINRKDSPMSDDIAAVAAEIPAEVAAAAPAPDPVPAVRASGIRVSESVALPTPGEFILASLSRDPGRMADMTRRIRAAAPHTFVADIPGVIPESIIGPVLHYGGMSPVFTALGALTAPAGQSFKVPYVDPSLPLAQAAVEKTDVTRQLGVKGALVEMEFIKRAVNISAEAIAYSQPSIIDVAVTELGDAIAVGSEAVITAGIEAVTGTNAPVTVAADGTDAWAKLAAGVSAHYAAAGRRPDAFLASPGLWADLAGMTNANGAPIVVGVSQNLGGDWGTLFGIPVTVSDQFTDGAGFLVDRAGVKSWQNGTVEMRVQEPTIMGYSIGAGRGVGLSVVGGKHITPVAVAGV